jgi:hypothetical protein
VGNIQPINRSPRSYHLALERPVDLRQGGRDDDEHSQSRKPDPQGPEGGAHGAATPAHVHQTGIAKEKADGCDRWRERPGDPAIHVVDRELERDAPLPRCQASSSSSSSLRPSSIIIKIIISSSSIITIITTITQKTRQANNQLVPFSPVLIANMIRAEAATAKSAVPIIHDRHTRLSLSSRPSSRDSHTSGPSWSSTLSCEGSTTETLASA